MGQNTKISIIGAAGKMGQQIMSQAQASDNFTLVGAIEAKGSSYLSNDISSFIGGKETGILVTDDPLECILKSDAIIDFKQTNKPKKEEWITDYKLQLAAYAMAHNYMHKTNITKGVIMMCSKDNYYQEFVVEGDEFKKYQHQWLGKVSQFYEQRSRSNDEKAKQSS